MTAEVDKKAIDRMITDVCVRIIREPLLYFSEADVQQMLVESLRTVDSLRRTVPTLVPKGLGSKNRHHTQLVHREYGGGDGRRVDVVIFDPKDVDNINDTNLMAGGTYLRPLYAFEIGTEKTADTDTHLKSDLAKLQNVKGAGYIIHFFRDTTLSPTGSGSRRRTEDKIDRSFRDAFNSIGGNIDEKIHVLAILLRTGRNQARMLGKCEVFDQEQGAWVKVNVAKESALREAILKQLK